MNYTITFIIFILISVISCQNPAGNNSEFDNDFDPAINIGNGGSGNSEEPSDPPLEAFEPNDINNLTLWFDSSDSNSLFQNSACSTPANNGDVVQCWQNKMGSVHATNSTNPPQKEPKGILFDGINDILSIAGKRYNLTSDITFFLAVKTDNQSTSTASCCRPMVSWVSASNAFYPWVGQLRDNLDNEVFYGFRSGAGIGAEAQTPGDEIIISAIHDGTNSRWDAFNNGVKKAFSEVINGTLSFTDFNIGGESSNSARRFAGSIYEILVYESVLSANDIEKVEGYLACKWDTRDQLPNSHDYYNIDPASNDNCPTKAP